LRLLEDTAAHDAGKKTSSFSNVGTRGDLRCLDSGPSSGGVFLCAQRLRGRAGRDAASAASVVTAFVGVPSFLTPPMVIMLSLV
jgi:hypothetical protein